MLCLVPALPLCAFFMLMLGFEHLGQRSLKFIGVAFIALAFITSAILGLSYNNQPYREVLWSWIPPTHLAFVLDPLSLLMIIVITFVAFLVALYSTQFMNDDPDKARFFAYLNLFVAAMLTLVLADNLLLLFAAWEGVGLCSYLLIGFWYKKPENGFAANKAFITTRIGDIFFLIGIIYLAIEFNTLTIQEVLTLSEKSPTGLLSITLITLCLLIGSMGKSAQVPFHTWLPDAMLGPTPASALIHAATMVTAGVYLMARMAPFFARAPFTQNITIIIGAITLVLGSYCALKQSDLKRVLAYSTISQIGYMFLALGAGAVGAAMFHFMTHAFFKALLFLGAGALGEALHHEYNMYKMGALRKELPLVYYTFLMGSAALVGLPLISAGFYSKELILGEVLAAQNAGLYPWLMGCLGAFLTALYVGRMIILVFFGKAQTPVSSRPLWPMSLPLVILGILSLSAGLLEKPLLAFLKSPHAAFELGPYLFASALVPFALLCSWLIFKNMRRKEPRAPRALFDSIYEAVLIKPYKSLAHALKNDFFSYFYEGLARLVQLLHSLLARMQSGQIQHYLSVLIASALAILGFLVFT